MSKFLCRYEFLNTSGGYPGMGLLDHTVATVFSFVIS